jgi:N-methylhydantoinase B
MNLPVEAMEMDAPIRVHRVALRQDSGGAGRHRGGLGVVKEYEILDGEIAFTYRGERHFFAPKGARGGDQGAKAHAVIQRVDGKDEVIPSKMMTTLRRGDRVLIQTAGGGGNGPPAERNRTALEVDIADGKVR